MFKPHLTICKGCRLYRIVVVKAMLCHQCNEAKKKAGETPRPIKSRSPINKRSEKRIRLDEAYKILRVQYLKDHPNCFANLKGICTKEAQDIHHLLWGKDREANMNDFTQVVSICRPCHTYTHSVMSKAEAIQRGLKKIEI